MPISNPHAFDGLLRRRIMAWVIDAGLVLILSWLVWCGAALSAMSTIGLASGMLPLPCAMSLSILYGTLMIRSAVLAPPDRRRGLAAEDG